MRVTRYQARQAHPVPSKVHAPRGPFPAELFQRPAVVWDNEDPYAEFGGVPLGSTAQTNFRERKRYRCSECGGIELENFVDSHVCTPLPQEPDDE